MLLLGVSAPLVTFELASGAVLVLVEVETSTFLGGGGAHPNVHVTTTAAAKACVIWVAVFTGRNLR